MGKRLAVTLLVSLLVAPLLAIGWNEYQWHAMNKAFEKVLRGDSEEVVVKLFGRPFYAKGQWDDYINWNDGEFVTNVQGGCVRLLHFSPPIPIAGESLVVGFDRRNRAVAKFHISSP